MGYIALREEDRRLLLGLHDFIYLDKKFIDKHYFHSYTNEKSSYHRLNRLKKEGYLKVYSAQIRENDNKTSHIYTLGELGAETVEAMKGVTHWKNSYSTAKRIRPFWDHQLMLAEVVKSFEHHAEDAGLEFKQFINEPRAFYEYPSVHGTKQKATIRPDGIVVVGKQGGPNVGLMLEMERSYSDKERTIRKIDQFNDFFARESELMPGYVRKVAFDEKLDGWKIIFIGGTEAKANKILRDLAEETPEVPVLVASKDDMEKNPFGAIYRDIRNPDDYRTL